MTDFVAICNQYVDDVLTGKILSCVWVRLACKRYRDDLARSTDDPEYLYYLNHKEVNRYCAFMSLLKHVKGPMAGKPFLLQPFQVFITANIVGWCKYSDNLRRTKEVCLTLPRKSGKSFYIAAFAVAFMCLDSDRGKEVITAANSEAQAGHVFIPARRMILESPELQRAFNIEVNAKSIVRHADGSRFFPICSLPSDGGNYSLAILDEMHEAESTELYDCVKSGQGSRSAPLLCAISTAGTRLSSPLYTWYLDGQKVLEGTTQREDLFCCFWTIDATDKWTDWTSVIKATPNLGISNNIEFLQTEQANAVRSAASQNRFRVKYLCEFMNSSARWLNMQKWHTSEDPKLRLVDFVGLPVVAGIDIANKIDISSYCLVFKKPHNNGKDHYYVFSHHYLPEERILEADKSHYQKWHHEGWITSTPGNATDHLMVCDDLIQDIKAYGVRELCVDPWGTQMLGQKVGAETNAELVLIPQTTKQLSPIMMELEALVLDGRIHSDGDPVLAWALSNIQVKADKNDCIYPTKERPDNKIDPAMALLDALSRAIVTTAPEMASFVPFFM